MPGRTPQEAVTAFLEPLRRAASALAGHSQLAVGRRGQYQQGHLYVWQLNGGSGMAWPGVGTFNASMGFEIIDVDPQQHDVSLGHLRVTTRSYHYHFAAPIGRQAKWRMHWHPEGQSDIVEPHLHRPPDIKQHWPTPRMSFETAIRWCVIEGAPLTCSDDEADNRLTDSEAAFKLFGSWQQTPSIRYNRPVQQPPT